MLHDLLFSVHLAVAGGPVMATPAQMLELVDSPAFFRTRHKDRPLKPLTPVKLQKYRIDYGVIDPQLKVEAKRSGTPAILEFAAAAYDLDGKLLNSQLNDGMASTDANPMGSRQRRSARNRSWRSRRARRRSGSLFATKRPTAPGRWKCRSR